MRLEDRRHRGLSLGHQVKAGEAICGAQPPLSLLQYSDSRSLCEVCSHCRRFCGSLRSALSKLLAAAQADVEQFVDSELIGELEQGRFRLRGRVVCEDCDAVCLDVNSFRLVTSLTSLILMHAAWCMLSTIAIVLDF